MTLKGYNVNKFVTWTRHVHHMESLTTKFVTNLMGSELGQKIVVSCKWRYISKLCLGMTPNCRQNYKQKVRMSKPQRLKVKDSFKAKDNWSFKDEGKAKPPLQQAFIGGTINLVWIQQYWSTSNSFAAAIILFLPFLPFLPSIYFFVPFFLSDFCCIRHWGHLDWLCATLSCQINEICLLPELFPFFPVCL